MTAIRITPRPGLFSITDYPNTTPGDDATGLRRAFAAAKAAGGGVIQLENKAGGYNLLSAEVTGSGYALINDEDRGFPITIQGRGVATTKVNVHAPNSTFIGINPIGVDAKISPINLYDMTVDFTGCGSTNHGALYHYAVSASQAITYSTVGRHYIERVNVTNLGHSVAPDRDVLKWAINRAGIAGAAALPTGYLRGLYLRNCDWGGGSGAPSVRGGGQGGVAIGAFVNASLGDKTASGIWKPSRVYGQNLNPGNCIVDDIVIENLSHTSGRSPVGVGDPGLGIQLGGDCPINYCRISGGHFRNSGDVGIELDGIIDGVIEGCQFRNIDGNNILLLPYSNNSGDTDHWNCVVRDCEAVYDMVDEYGTTNTLGGSPQGSAFASNARFGCISEGQLLWENCTARYESPCDAGTTMFSIGPTRRQVVRDCRVVHRGTQTGATFNAMVVLATGRPQTLVIDGFRFDRNTAIDTVTCTDTVVSVGSADSLRVEWNGIGHASRGAQTNSGKRSSRMLGLAFGATEPTNSFTTDLLDAEFIFETGLSTDYTYNSGSHWYTATTGLSSEKRAYWPATNTSTGADNLIGKARDGAVYFQMKTGAALTGYKGGAYGKRKDASNYLEAYVYDNGTNTYLCLDKVLAGTRSSLLPAAGGTATGANTGGDMVTDTIASPPSNVSTVGLVIGTRLTTAKTHYIALTVQQNTVSAEHWVSAEPGQAGTHPAGTGDAWCSATITDTTTFGDRSNGEFGFSQVPIEATAQLTKSKFRRLHVISGKIGSAVVGSLDAMAGAFSGFYLQNGFSSKARVDGILEFTSNDFRNIAQSAGTKKDFDLLAGTTAFMQKMRMRNNQYYAAIADTAITFVSGTAWQNQTGCWGSVYVQGGTVTKIEVSKDGTTYRDTGAIAGAFPMPPEWYIKLTHSGAPTAYFAQED